MGLTPEQMDAPTMDEHCIRHLVCRQPLAAVLWNGDSRKTLMQALKSVHGNDKAKSISKNVDQQVVYCAFRRISAEFQAFADDKSRLNIHAVLSAVKELDENELVEEPAYLILVALVHSALHFLLSARDIETAWPTANKMLHKRERINESSDITDLRARATLHIKKCAQVGLTKGAKEMAFRASEYELEFPVRDLIAEMRKYSETLINDIGPLWSEHTDRDTEIGANHNRKRTRKIAQVEPVTPNRKRSRGNIQVSEPQHEENQNTKGPRRSARIARSKNPEIIEQSEDVEEEEEEEDEESEEEDESMVDEGQGKRRGRGRGTKAKGRKSERMELDTPRDDEDEDEDDSKKNESESMTNQGRGRGRGKNVQVVKVKGRRSERIERETPRRDENEDDDGSKKGESDELDSLSEGQRKAVEELEDAQNNLKKAIGEDPIHQAEAHARTARQKKSMYHVSPNGREASPIEESSDEDDEQRTPRPARVMPFALELEGESQSSPNGSQKKKNNVRKGPFTGQEDLNLIKGLKEYGWSEWNLISINCWTKMPYKRSAAQVKDRARYLLKVNRIKKHDYPGEMPRVRPGPPNPMSPRIPRSSPVRSNRSQRNTPLRRSARKAKEEDVDSIQSPEPTQKENEKDDEDLDDDEDDVQIGDGKEEAETEGGNEGDGVDDRKGQEQESRTSRRTRRRVSAK